MKKILTSLMVLMFLLTACGANDDSRTGINDDLNNGNTDAATSGMVDDVYFLTGELKEIVGNRLLIDAEDVGLIWVSFDEEVNLDIPLRSIVRAQFSGEIMESYPAQANGFRLEVVELYTSEALYTMEQLETMFSDPTINHVVVWNDMKDQIAFTTVDETMAKSYHVYVMDLYTEGAIEVGFVKNELPDLNWFFDKLEIQTTHGSQEVGPDFKATENVLVIEGQTLETNEEEISYQLEAKLYEDNDNNVTIEFYEMSGYVGELVQDYSNQALRKIVDVYSNNYKDVKIEAEILKEDNFVTIGYKGVNESMGYEIEDYITIDVPTSDILTVDNVIGDLDGFKQLFEEETGYVYDEQEGVKVYLVGFDLHVTFVPTDDMAERVNFSFFLHDISPLLDMKFITPAS